MFNNKKGFCALVMIVMLLSTSQTALANAGPIISLPHEKDILFFDENSNIALETATVVFSDFEYASAKVSVNYVLINLDESEKEITAYFVLPYINSTDTYKVLVNNVDITESCLYEKIRLPDNWEPSVPMKLINPENKEELAVEGEEIYTDEYGDEILPHGLIFPLSMDGNETTQLDIEYLSYVGYYRGNKVVNWVHGTIYYLTPAKFWSGEPQLTLKVELPYKRHSFYSNIPLEKGAEGIYSTTMQGIPETEWIFSFNSRSGLIFLTNNGVIHNRIIFTLISTIFILSLFLSLYRKNGLIFFGGYIFSVLLFLYYIMGVFPYGAERLIKPFLVIIGISIVAPLIVIQLKRLSSKHFT